MRGNTQKRKTDKKGSKAVIFNSHAEEDTSGMAKLDREEIRMRLLAASLIKQKERLTAEFVCEVDVYDPVRNEDISMDVYKVVDKESDEPYAIYMAVDTEFSDRTTGDTTIHTPVGEAKII